MDVHKNAPLTPAGREAMVRRVAMAEWEAQAFALTNAPTTCTRSW
jgi:hypothetical protein